MLRYFVGRELKGRFTDSLLGPLWVLLHPLFLFAVYFIVFTKVMGFDRGSVGPEHFAVYLFSGLICFHLITNATSGALGSIVGNSNIVKKVKFPCEVLPLVPVFVETVVFGIGLFVVFVVGFLLGQVQLTWSLLAFPWFVATLVLFSAGLGLVLANLEVFVRDVRQLWAILATAWFFLSPNFWSPSFLQQQGGLIAEVLPWNPAYHLLLAQRTMLGLGRPELGFTETVVHDLGIASIWAVAFLLLGYGTFMANKHKYADLV